MDALPRGLVCEVRPAAIGAPPGLSASLQSIAWQAAGSAATLGAALWVSWRFGLAAQGDFGLARSWFDAAAALAAFGVPQGLLHVMYRLGTPAGQLRPLVMRALLALCGVAVLVAALLWQQGFVLAAAVVATAPLGAGHLCARSFLMAQRGVVTYGAATALPSLLILAAVLAASVLPAPPAFIAWLAASTVAAALVSLALASRAAPAQPTNEAAAPALRALRSVSLQSGLQTALGALLGAGLLSAIAALGHRGEALGAASLGLHLYQAFVVLAGYVSPLLFDRWARQRELQTVAWPAPARRVLVLTVSVAMAGLCAALLAPHQAVWLMPSALMLLAGVAALAARIAGTVLLARGAYAELTLQAAWRLGLALAVLVITVPWLGAATALAAALLVIELATWWRASAVAQRLAMS